MSLNNYYNDIIDNKDETMKKESINDNLNGLKDNYNTIKNRLLPYYNCKEKIIIVIDRAQDENSTNFLINNSNIKPFSMLKRAVELFIKTKSLIDAKHEYALVILNENNADWLIDFTSEIYKVIDVINKLTTCETEDIYDINSLFDLICDFVSLSPINDSINDYHVPPPFIYRMILFYGRSYTLPKIILTEEINLILNHCYFTVDVLMTHEPVDIDNNCDKIFNILQNFDKKGFAFFFSVARNTNLLYSSMAKLLSHPLQRPTQKIANYHP